MRTIPLGKSGLNVPCVAVGCMRINKLSDADAEKFIKTAIDAGANFFDHADIYGGGSCETIFGRAVNMSPKVREGMILQSKCGIVPGKMFDFSREHILEAVDGSLKRLNTDYLDALLLHRPDALVEPDEVGEAFDRLKAAGKVRHFGVSNQNPMQIQLLQSSLNQPIVANQLQLSITHAGLVAEGLHVNMWDETGVNRNGSVLDYCRLNEITVQPWSPFQYGFFEGVFIGSPKYPKLNETLDKLAAKYSVTPTTIAMAWLLRHPARLQPITGTMNIGRLLDCV
ncbi:MAG: aldo/keto reductase, partial [Oscillospiraceae bacterium]|nr:aldo/keto reductase [Oscillospiraceae bacterium]